jgi:8-amino-7-oxononanoate synthase
VVSDYWQDARDQLASLESCELLRTMRFSDVPPGASFSSGGRDFLNFSSNNYLGLAGDNRVVAAAKRALDEFGAGTGGSRLISGSMRIHCELEEKLAQFKGQQAALVFSSGYLANLGVIQALASRCDQSRVPVFMDRLCHASIIDGVRLCASPWRSFPHNDCEALAAMLTALPKSGKPRAIVITEGVFSMDGDVCPLPQLLRLCEEHDALLIIDDAHATGTIGAKGCGSGEFHEMGCSPNLVHVGTLSKALGSQGGFVAGCREMVELLMNRARTFIFDTALAPPCAGAALESIRILQSEPEIVAQLQCNSRQLRGLLELSPEAEGMTSPIIPVVLGTARKTMEATKTLADKGFLVVGIRPPTVRRGTSRLRIAVNRLHTGEQIESLAAAIHSLNILAPAQP